jgi:hypothetical protein
MTTALAESESVLLDAMRDCYDDPSRFVRFAFNWGSGDLDGFDGPDTWQAEFLDQVGGMVEERAFDGVHAVESIRLAVASGHGIGKSTITAWLILWIMSTRPHCKGVVTANTSAQLETKTWAELAKWHKRCATSHWFRLTTGKMSMRIAHVGHPETWRCDALTCREENSEAFAGLHAANSTPFYIFDEASAIPDAIWDVAEGGMTDGEPMWFAFGNPTRNTGRFRECFGRYRHRWATRQIDSRTARMTNKAELTRWVDDYGEDSDFVRVRVRGVFPRAGSMQFIASDVVETAADPQRDVHVELTDPVVFGVDVARFGDDSTVIAIRRGRDARSIPWVVLRGVDTMTVAATIVDLAEKLRPDAIFVDGGGVGGGVVDRLRYLAQPVHEVQFGGKSDRAQLTQDGRIVYANKRAEMWGTMRDWLPGAIIPNAPELVSDLPAVEYGYVFKDGRDAIQLERKEDMKKRGLASPDHADALALTFAYPVAPHDQTAQMRAGFGRAMHQSDYDPFGSSWSPHR